MAGNECVNECVKHRKRFFKIFSFVIINFWGLIFMVKGIEHVAIFGKDTESLKNWYIEMFDFKQVYENGKGTFFLAAPDGAMIEFVKTLEDGGVIGDKVSGIRHLALAVDDFEGMVERLMDKQVEVVSAPITAPNGIKTFFFKDPEGNVLHFIDRPTPLC